MSTILKWLGIAIGIFVVLFIIWYLTGGPKRDATLVKPYVNYDYPTIDIQPSDKSLPAGAQEMFNVTPGVKAVEQIKEDSYNRY